MLHNTCAFAHHFILNDGLIVGIMHGSQVVIDEHVKEALLTWIVNKSLLVFYLLLLAMEDLIFIRSYLLDIY